jgi:hypothetical protein
MLSFGDKGADNQCRTVAELKKVQTVAKSPQVRRLLKDEVSGFPSYPISFEESMR